MKSKRVRREVMKILIQVTLAILVLLLITGCQTVPEKEIVTVYKTVSPVTVDVKHPELPDELPVPDISYQVINVFTVFEDVMGTLIADETISDETKESLLTSLDLSMRLQAEKDPLIYIALDQDNGNKQAVYFEKLVSRLEAYRSIVEHYRSQKAVILVE